MKMSGVDDARFVAAVKEYREAWKLISARNTAAGVSDWDEIERLYDEGLRISEWLHAESYWKRDVRWWLDAESEWNAKEYRRTVELGDPAYRAAEKGWNEMRRFVPNLDGVPSFDRLSDSLRFRYAAFAAAVLDVDVPAEVRSLKQERDV